MTKAERLAEYKRMAKDIAIEMRKLMAELESVDASIAAIEGQPTPIDLPTKTVGRKKAAKPAKAPKAAKATKQTAKKKPARRSSGNKIDVQAELAKITDEKLLTAIAKSNGTPEDIKKKLGGKVSQSASLWRKLKKVIDKHKQIKDVGAARHPVYQVILSTVKIQPTAKKTQKPKAKPAAKPKSAATKKKQAPVDPLTAALANHVMGKIPDRIVAKLKEKQPQTLAELVKSTQSAENSLKATLYDMTKSNQVKKEGRGKEAQYELIEQTA